MPKATYKMIPLAELIEDTDIYPRANISRQNVGYLKEAVQAGAVIPPLVVQAKTNRIVDGFHRYRAYKQLMEPTDTVKCEIRTYESEAELFLDAVALNCAHGVNMNTYDRVHASILADKLDIELDRLAISMHMSIDRLVEIAHTRRARSNGDNVPLKRTVSHLAGKKLTKKQRECNKRLGGMTQLYYVNTIIELVSSDSVDWDKPALVERLKDLGRLLATHKKLK